jgi:c-di-GMP-binding flagellar brake protein YcgR
MSEEEQRVHARIHVSTEICVRPSVNGAGTPPTERVEATLRDLSKGGARFSARRSVGRPGETIELYLPSLLGPEIIVTGQIIRAGEPAPGEHVVAVRFSEIDPSMLRPLAELIDVLLSTSGGQQRAHPRVSRRMDIRFGELAELKAILEDISAGGLAMTIATPLVLYEELDVTVPDTAGEQLLILRARVVNQRVIEEDGQTAYRVGLEVGPLRLEARRCLDQLLQAVMETLDGVTVASE